MNKDAMLTVRIERDKLEKIHAIAKQKKIKASAFIRDAIELSVKKLPKADTTTSD